MTRTIGYVCTVKHHSVIGQWKRINAKSDTDAKSKAWKLFGAGFVGHTIHLCKSSAPIIDGEPEFQYFDAYPKEKYWTRTIGEDKKWSEQ